MIVAELIEKLKAEDQNAIVVVEGLELADPLKEVDLRRAAVIYGKYGCYLADGGEPAVIL